MRRLPIYFLIDTKTELKSEYFNSLNLLLSMMLNNFRGNPMMVETAHLSINSLSENNYKINDLEPIDKINSIQLISTESCFLGKNLSLLSEYIQKEKIKIQHRKQDYPHNLFIFLCNEPDDNYKKYIAQLKKQKGNTVVITFSNNLNIENLKLLSENIVDAYTTDSHSISKFFWWDDDLELCSSEKINTNENTINLKKEISKSNNIFDEFVLPPAPLTLENPI